MCYGLRASLDSESLAKEPQVDAFGICFTCQGQIFM